MPPKKQLVHLKEARNFRYPSSPYRILDCKRFVFSVIVEGQSYSTTSHIFLWNNLIPPSKSTFYNIQKEISDIIVEYAVFSCAKWKNDKSRSKYISFDGSWSHRRNANQCVVAIIDPVIRKILDFVILEKPNEQKPGNFDGPSNQMEVEGIRRLIPKWKNDEKAEYYVHDKDSKCKKEIEKSKWDIRELIDKNHLMKSYERRWNKYKAMTPCKFRGLHNKLRFFFLFLLKEDLSHQEKVIQWINVSHHLMGKHQKCLHEAKMYPIWKDGFHKENILILKLFLNSTAKLLLKCNDSVSTQMCESFHAIKCHFANKNTKWSESWRMRISSAILSINEPNWKFVLYQKLGLPSMPRQISQILHQIDAEKDRNKTKRRDPEYLKKVKDYRIEKRAKIKKKIEESEIEYKPLEKVKKRRMRRLKKCQKS
ncbi:hypothetical protein TRFO_02672 [Tritrichomonas foetus]|uniref:Mutator-like transposase domain-containing protein n=1 Tax=Tritrichomonas foetus TaxID=1144522 RepID=A0A1J4KYU0_9EUKA|nr:hypothetical protein TRFO_02672 [Tritrichomonas foetus]|eukprot:OHT16419.1 hypothetical protein TRFO_02672 [Tritrichomonas foetus]